jgi:hypothetical protein
MNDIITIERDEVVFHHGGRSAAEIRSAIDALKDQLLACEGAQTDWPAEHTFADGMYMRTLFIPKGTLLVGKIHRKTCLNILASGDISILTEHGARRVRAGFTGVSQPGIQKVGFAHADTIFINVFRTEETDLARVEAEIACESLDLVSRRLS